jgi:hypothetical protein
MEAQLKIHLHMDMLVDGIAAIHFVDGIIENIIHLIKQLRQF